MRLINFFSIKSFLSLVRSILFVVIFSNIAIANGTEFSYQDKTYYDSIVRSHIAQINPNRFWDNLSQLSDTETFPDRFAKSDDGLKAAEWLRDKVLDIATKAGRKDVTWRFIDTGEGYKQPSLVVRVGDQDENVPGVVIGSHMDTTSKDESPFDGVKPGADDDGSGSVLTLEVAEVILNSDQRFKKPIYFMWYAAEELGLVGSKIVAAEFVSKNIKLDAILHLEVAGYQNPEDAHRLWVITDYVDPNLTNYLEILALNFSDITDVGRTKCGYACSDHASWHAAGYPVAIPCEAKFEESNPFMHSANDTMDNLNINHMVKFAKLGLAFVIEQAEPII